MAFTDTNISQNWGKTGIPALTAAIDANFALIESGGAGAITVDSLTVGACTTGIKFTGALATAGIDFSSSTVTMAANRTNSFIRIGNYAATRAPIVISDLTQTFAPVQMHLDIQATSNGAQSVRPLWLWTEVSTADQSDLTVYGIMNYVDVQKNVSHLYGSMHQIVLSSDAQSTVTAGEVHAVQGTLEVSTGKTLTTSGSYASTAINGSIKGEGTFTNYAYCIGGVVEPSATATGVMILSVDAGSTVTHAIKINLPTTSNCSYLMNITDTDTQIFDSSSSATANATLKIKVNNTDYYILLSTAS